MIRAPGPHPLPLFLATLQAACADDPARLAAALAGLARYQSAVRPLPAAVRPVAAVSGNVCLRGHPGPRCVIVVPSLINPPDVLDLPGHSLIAHLEAAGFNPLLVDWGPVPEPLGLADLVEQRLLPLLDGLESPPALLGYCLGGTLALAVAARRPVRRLALIATPWDFSGHGVDGRAALAAWWSGAAPLAEAMGQLPIDLLQPAFWALDPAGLAAKYARLVTASPDALADFVRLEDWANGGAPISLAAARDLAALFAENATGEGRWQVAGAPVRPADIAAPILDIIADNDRIVPAACAVSAGGVGEALHIASGHVGMVVGRRAPEQMWAPLAGFLCQA